jgi:peptidoglycan hydrolase CwlO-like protein
LDKKLSLAQIVSEFHDSCKYQEKISELNRNIKTTSQKCDDLRRDIDDQTDKFDKMHGDSVRNLK